MPGRARMPEDQEANKEEEANPRPIEARGMP